MKTFTERRRQFVHNSEDETEEERESREFLENLTPAQWVKLHQLILDLQDFNTEE